MPEESAPPDSAALGRTCAILLIVLMIIPSWIFSGLIISVLVYLMARAGVQLNNHLRSKS